MIGKEERVRRGNTAGAGRHNGAILDDGVANFGEGEHRGQKEGGEKTEAGKEHSHSVLFRA